MEFESLKDALSKDPHVKNCRIKIEENAKIIFLRGSVKSFYQKQVAQETVKKAMNGSSLEFQIVNDISVDT